MNGRLWFALGLFTFVLCGCDSRSLEPSIAGSGNQSPVAKAGWIGAWAAAPFGPYPLGVFDLPVNTGNTTVFPGNKASNQSFRMIVHPTIGGKTLRIRLSNLVGERAVSFDSVHVALRAAGAAIMPASDTAVPFGGRSAISIAPGAEAISDPVRFTYSFGDSLAISFHVVGESGAITWHEVSFGANFVGLPSSGDTTADPSGARFTQVSTGWFFLSGVDVLAPETLGTVVALGDSITDGAFSLPETNTRWPDFLAQRLHAANIPMSVLNEGINGNTVVSPCGGGQGQPALERFERDVLGRAGVRSVVIFEGTNDLTGGVKGTDIYAALAELTRKAHAAGLCVVLGTITPRDDPMILAWNRTTMEPERQALNALIRADTTVEGIADFDAVMGNPADPTRPNPLYFSPDLLHPSTLGFMVMANSVPLEALAPAPVGSCRR